ncbi:MAG TPA: hypothetical protein PKC72_13975 [Chitinophagaceae bacterium]|nr:hypothetical protein [Chitinophagaceae bacterium]
MTGLIVILLFTSLLIWLLVSPLVISLDTRIPIVQMKWATIGEAGIWYDETWKIKFRILFFRKTIQFNRGKKKITAKKKSIKSKKRKIPLQKIIRLLKTFKINKWNLSVDSGDYIENALLYPMNFLRPFQNHLNINFNDENYLFIEITNRPWKILFAMMR